MEASKNIQLCQDGKYRWTYEVNMLRTPVILYEVFWVLEVTIAIFALLMSFFMLITGNLGLKGLWTVAQSSLIAGGILFVLSIPAYYIVAMKNGKKYVVLFEMDEEGIVHKEIKHHVKREKALMWIGILAGLLAGSPGRVGATITAATHNSLSSTYARVKKVKAMKRYHCINVNGRFVRNRIFVEDDDFDFVFNYIASRCTNAKIKP